MFDNPLVAVLMDYVSAHQPEEVARVGHEVTGPDRHVLKVAPLGQAPALELRVTGSVADFFIGELPAIEIDARNNRDLSELRSILEALSRGELSVRYVRIFGRWRPRAVECDAGSWSFPVPPMSRRSKERVEVLGTQ
ncbi:hypothetical protein [Amycolatopsis nigrescens]|uniref:hypothetical protein n=1 Tax=Amycolatopsis nigrescens TaxID=381445 RepID=UPI00035FA010|nr:hypothetical protein [Amycolatopsis nigrescens]